MIASKLINIKIFFEISLYIKFNEFEFFTL